MMFEVFLPYFEGEGDAGDAGGEGGEGAAGDPKPKTFTQEDVNQLLAKEKRGYQKQISDLSGKLTNLSLTAQEKAQVEQELETVRSNLRTKEEQAQHEMKKAKDAHQNEVKTLSEERDQWKSKYTDSTITRSILDAAVKHKAFSPEQVVAILKSNTQLTEDVGDDGKPNGNLSPKTKINLPGSDGKIQELELSPDDAVKRMTEATEMYGNLFVSGTSGGMGFNPNQASGKPLNIQKLAQNPAEYRAARKAGKI